MPTKEKQERNGRSTRHALPHMGDAGRGLEAPVGIRKGKDPVRSDLNSARRTFNEVVAGWQQCSVFDIGAGSYNIVDLDAAGFALNGLTMVLSRLEKCHKKMEAAVEEAERLAEAK